MTVRRRLDAELVRRGLLGSRRQAVEAIAAGRVLVGGSPAVGPTRMVGPDESISVTGEGHRYVSRGGEKLAGALEEFAVPVAGRRALDAGASTGGFTDCLLQAGAAHVVAVDVGRGQLAWSLREDARVTVMERTNVRALEPDDGYTRERFGQAWADVDGNGCDTRNDVLARDLADARLDPGGCLVLAGTLDDPYTGTVIAFVRGPDSATVQIDHLVALDDAWRTGARSWPAARRLGFANDPANLIAVSGDANQDKGASDASQWLPPQAGYACVYVVRQLRIKVAYGLWMIVTGRRSVAMMIGVLVLAVALIAIACQTMAVLPD